MLELNESAVSAYLNRWGFFDDRSLLRITELVGGVSNRVLRVESAPDCVVLKQPFTNLVVERDWQADLDRVQNEAAAARAFAAILDRLSVEALAVPDVRHENDEDHVIGIECGTPDAETWKQALMDGRLDVLMASLAGRVIGRRTASRPGIRKSRPGSPPERPFR